MSANTPVTLNAATNLDDPWGITFDSSGDLYIGTWDGYSGVDVISPTSQLIFGQSVSANTLASLARVKSMIRNPRYLRFDSSGNLYIMGDEGLYALNGPAAIAIGPAVSFAVNSVNDAPLADPSGTTCVSTDAGACTLRAAVQAADNASGPATITLPAGTYTLSIPSTTGDDPSTGDLDVDGGSVTITGAGSGSSIIDANGIDRAFAVQDSSSLTISGVTIEHGAQPDASPSDNSSDSGIGGAIYNDGSLSVTDSTFSDNSSEEGGGVVYADDDATATSITNSIITGSAVGDDDGGAVDVDAGTLTLNGDTITHSTADGDGGAIYVNDSGSIAISGTTISESVANGRGGAVFARDSGSLSIADSTLDDNISDGQRGGAVYVDGVTTTTISDSTISNNSSGDDQGGAIYVDEGSLAVANSDFANDNAGAGNGGGIYLDDADLSVTSSTFTGDSGGNGGAIYLQGDDTPSITSTAFSGNHATEGSGGAIDDSDGNLEISSSTFSGNDSSNNGGAFFYSSGDDLALTNDTLDGNQAASGGGAIFLDDSAESGTIALLNNTIVNNAAYFGGGIVNPEYANTIENTIVADNSGGVSSYGGGDCYSEVSTDNAGSADVGGNIDSDGSCFSSSTPGDVTNVDPSLAPLAQNGGAVQTDATYSNSPAVGPGVSSPLACPTTDARGVTRTDTCDSGAYQDSSLSAPPSSTLNTLPSSPTFFVDDNTDAPLVDPSGTICDSTDGDTCTLRAAIQAADNLGGAATISLPAGTYTLSIPSTTGDDPSSGDLDVINTASITLTGQGASNTVINANGIDRAFNVQGGSSLSIAGVTIERGAQPEVSVGSHSSDAGYGGAICNDGSLSVTDSIFSDDSSAYDGGVVFADEDATATSITNSIITGSTVGDGSGGAVYVDAGTLTLSGDTITHSSATGEGGAILEDGSGSLTISGTTISGSVASSNGGAIADEGSGAFGISSSTISDNITHDEVGGAIYDDGDAGISISGSTISNNSTGNDSGAAIYDNGGLLTVTNSTFAYDNSGDGNGGAIFTNGEDLSVTGSTFTGDEGSSGGAIYVDGMSGTAVQSIASSAFSGNQATDSDGGAIYDDYGDLQISSSSFTGNEATYYGGALYDDSGDGLALTNDTLDGNQTVGLGGGIYFGDPAGSGTIALLNTTIARNVAYRGGGIAYPEYADTIQNTIVADNVGVGDVDGGNDCYSYSATDNGGSADVGGNIDSDGSCFSSSTPGDKTTVDPLLAPVALDETSGTAFDALLSGSPAIGAGVTTPLTCPATDQIGQQRGSFCDSGAYESTHATGGGGGSPPTGPTNAPAPITATVPATTFGMPTSITASSTTSLTLTQTSGGASEAILVPAGALPSGTTVTVYPVVETAPLVAQVPAGSSYVLSFAVTWQAPDGTSPNATTPITVTITDPDIVIGDTIYETTSTGLVAVGTATANGTVTITFSSDPTFLAVHKNAVAKPRLTASKVKGSPVVGRSVTLKIVGTGFYGTPKITSNETGTKVTVSHVSATLLTVRVKVKAGSRKGAHTFTIHLADGRSCKVNYIVK